MRLGDAELGRWIFGAQVVLGAVAIVVGACISNPVLVLSGALACGIGFHLMMRK